jgi:hypothetical protein
VPFALDRDGRIYVSASIQVSPVPRCSRSRSNPPSDPRKPVSGDPQALSVFVPVEVQDALVVPYSTMELQDLRVYTHDNHTAGGSI